MAEHLMVALRHQDRLGSVKSRSEVVNHGLIDVARHVLGVASGLDVFIEVVAHCLSARVGHGGPHQKVFWLHIHALIHHGVAGKEGGVHHGNMSHGWHRLCVVQCRVLDEGLDVCRVFLMMIAFVAQFLEWAQFSLILFLLLMEIFILRNFCLDF